MKTTIIIALCAVLLIAGCIKTVNVDPYHPPPQNDNKTTGLANPASVYCEQQGGTLKIIDQPAGQVGECTLPDNTVCEEWSYYRGECGPGYHLCAPNERAENKACTMDYNPVCGRIVLNTGVTTYQTFGNGCGACAGMKVVSYTRGECPTQNTTCGTCPVYPPPDPLFCDAAGAKIVPGLKDACGCTGPPQCEMTITEPAAPVACTMDAKACPDGSFVGRVAPNCDWAPCPGPAQI